MDAPTIANGLTSSINSNFSSSLNNALSAAGLTGAQLSQISGLFSNILAPADATTLQGVAQGHLNNMTTLLTSAASALQSNTANAAAVAKKPGAQKNYVVQDAKYGKPIAEKIAPLSNLTKVPDFPSANSEMTAEYPNTKGHMDDGGNWYKINKTTGYVEFVHNSGSSLKIDKTGNVSVRITGSFKWIVDSDFLMNILGNHDFVVTGSEYKASLKNFEHHVDANSTLKITNLLQILSGQVDIN